MKNAFVGSDNPGRFLPPVLERVKAQIGQFGRAPMTENTKNPAVVMYHRV